MSGYYQKPDTPKPDFAYWAKKRVWTESEVAALLLGLNPYYVWIDGNVSFSAESYKDEILGLLRLAIDATSDWSFGVPPPARWLAWARDRELPIPPELEAAIPKYDRAAMSAERARITEPKTRVAELTVEANGPILDNTGKAQTLGTRERESMLTLIIAMAIEGYKFDPLAQRSDKIKEIVDDIKKCGLTLSDDTVRKYLREAAALLPPKEGREP